MLLNLRFILALSFALLLLCLNCFAATNSATNALIAVKSTPALNTTVSNQQFELQLQAQELQLEQQLLQAKQQLLQLQQRDLQQKSRPSIDLQWTSAGNGQIPKNAVIAANANNKPLYICHSDYQGSIHPGQLTDKGCIITYGGHIITQSAFQVLTGNYAVVWKAKSAVFRSQSMPFPGMTDPRMFVMPPYSNPHFPIDFNSQDIPVPGGNENGRTLYICRAMLGYQIHLGKVVANNCNVADQGKEVPVSTYEVLFAKGSN